MRILLTWFALVFSAGILSAQYVYDPFGFNKEEIKAVKANKVRSIKVFLADSAFLDTANYIMATEFSKSSLPVQSVYRTDETGAMTEDCMKYYLCGGRGGAVTRETFNCSDSDEIVTIYHYDRKGVLAKREIIAADPVTYYYTSEKGKIKTCKGYTRYPSYNENGDFEGKTIDVYNTYIEYEYNKKGELTKETVFWLGEDQKMSVNNITAYEYNKKGQLSVCKTFSSEVNRENLVNTTTYAYFENGLLRRETNIDLYAVRSEGEAVPEVHYYYSYEFFDR